MTFIDYINSMRIYHAEQLLIKTQISITEISFQVGFSSTAYFIKVFKRYNFCTPSNYRKMFLASRNSQ
jgi:AraC-like DNA-binding protein